MDVIKGFYELFHSLLTGFLSFDRGKRICTLLISATVFCMIVYTMKNATGGEESQTPLFVTILYLLVWFALLYYGRKSRGILLYSLIVSGLSLFYTLLQYAYFHALYFQEASSMDFLIYIFFAPPPLCLWWPIVMPLWGIDLYNAPLFVALLFTIVLSVWFVLSLLLHRKMKTTGNLT